MKARDKTGRRHRAPAPVLERTYTLLKEMIADGRIKPGERLREAQIASAFAISRSPARDALALLLAGRLVVADGGLGFRVAGTAAAGARGTAATLEPIRIAVPRRWERMYEEVERDLLIHLLFGSLRINELQLAQRFNVSRTVTRDLLARMHGDGLIAKDTAGHWVAAQITPDRIRHLYELRGLLEPQALRLAAPHVPRQLLADARAVLVAARTKARLKSREFDKVERDLHVGVLAFCPNTEILRALARTHVLFAPTRHLFDPYLQIPSKLIRDALDEHLAIVDALVAGNVRKAATMMKAHLEDAVDRWLRRFTMTARVRKLSVPSYLRRVGTEAVRWDENALPAGRQRARGRR
jgi:DNA-binding GntR family transcriptional regulator